MKSQTHLLPSAISALSRFNGKGLGHYLSAMTNGIVYRVGGYALLAILVLCGCPLTASAEKPSVVYRWDAAAWLTKLNPGQFSAEPITNPDGTIGAQVTVSPRDAGNPYNHILVSAASMKGGNQYTAIVTFSIATPTKYPASFYMFARNSAGNQYDIWRTWIGLPGVTRTIALPLDLKAIDNGTWKLYMGISKSGAININSIIVYSGLTSDGIRAFVTAPPTTNVSPVCKLPDGVKEATGYTPFTINPPATTQPATQRAAISLANYNFVADVSGAAASVASANAVALQRAIDDCKTKGASTLIIPKGIYRIAPVSSIKFDTLSDVTIDGQSSVLMFENLTKDGPAIFISHCTRTVLQNFFVDWDWNAKPIASLGTVSNLSADKLQCDFTFPDLDAEQTELTRTTPWHAIFAMDPTSLTRTEVNIFQVPKETKIRAGSAPNILHVSFPKPVPFENGTSYCIRHMYYEMGAFKVLDSTDLTFNAVDIYSIPGMGWFFEGGMHDFQLVDCHILRAPNSRHPFTTAADGIHVDQFVDNLNIENCSITGAGDDGMNIHNECYQGEIIPDPTDLTKITLLNCPPYQLRLKPGDPIDFYNADFSNLDGSDLPTSAKVLAVSSTIHGAPDTVIHLATTRPANLTPQSIVDNGRFTTSNVHIAGCNIEYTYGRGILLSAKNVLVENCRFNHVYCAAINLESEIVQPLWTEGRGASNVLIKNNIFENDNPQGRYGGAIIYTDAHIPWGPTAATIYSQISVENNHFVNCPGPAVSLSNASNVIIRGNQLQQAKSIPSFTRYSGTLFITNSSGLALGGNSWMNATSMPWDSGVLYDPATVSNICCDTNALIDSH